MSRSAWIAAIILSVGAVGLFLFTRQLQAQRAQAELAERAAQERLRKDQEVRPAAGHQVADRDFAGKFLVISMRQVAYYVTLQNVTVRKLDGQSFLVGVPVKNSVFPSQNETAKTIWVSLNEISAIREFDNLKDVSREERRATN